MNYIIFAGVLNGAATIFLKQSNNNPILIWISLLLFGLNFLFFRTGLEMIKAASGYSILITVSLLTLLIYGIFTKTTTISNSLFLSLTLFLGSLYLFLKYSN